MHAERPRRPAACANMDRMSSQMLLDMLEVPQRSRTAGTYRRLAKLMTELGWTAVRVRDLTRGGYLEQVRGYCRDARFHSNQKTNFDASEELGGVTAMF